MWHTGVFPLIRLRSACSLLIVWRCILICGCGVRLRFGCGTFFFGDLIILQVVLHLLMSRGIYIHRLILIENGEEIVIFKYETLYLINLNYKQSIEVYFTNGIHKIRLKGLSENIEAYYMPFEDVSVNILFLF